MPIIDGITPLIHTQMMGVCRERETFLEAVWPCNGHMNDLVGKGASVMITSSTKYEAGYFGQGFNGTATFIMPRPLNEWTVDFALNFGQFNTFNYKSQYGHPTNYVFLNPANSWVPFGRIDGHVKAHISFSYKHGRLWIWKDGIVQQNGVEVYPGQLTSMVISANTSLENVRVFSRAYTGVSFPVPGGILTGTETLWNG